MSINPQYTYDNNGTPLGVFLSLNDWNQLAAQCHLDIPEWQKHLLDARLKEYYSNPSQMEDADTLLAELDKEDEA